MPWRRLPRSSNPSPSGAAKRSSHSKWAAPKRKRPPSTVPSVATSSGSVPSAAGGAGVEHDAQLVEEDLLAGAVGVEVGGVDHLAQLRLDEEVAEHRELHGEVAHLARASPSPPANQLRVAVVDDDGVAGDERRRPGRGSASRPGAVAMAMARPPRVDGACCPSSQGACQRSGQATRGSLDNLPRHRAGSARHPAHVAQRDRRPRRQADPGACAETPRAGVMELARQLGVARGTVQARLDKLQQRGVISGFDPDLDLAGHGLRGARLRHPRDRAGPARRRHRAPRRRSPRCSRPTPPPAPATSTAGSWPAPTSTCSTCSAASSRCRASCRTTTQIALHGAGAPPGAATRESSDPRLALPRPRSAVVWPPALPTAHTLRAAGEHRSQEAPLSGRRRPAAKKRRCLAAGPPHRTHVAGRRRTPQPRNAVVWPPALPTAHTLPPPRPRSAVMRVAAARSVQRLRPAVGGRSATGGGRGTSGRPGAAPPRGRRRSSPGR